MPKCLECGKVFPRLQWTHFKFTCTGRFSNVKEYQAEFPGAKIVDDDVAKKTAITFENLVQKYGEIEGQIRWNQYREKQSISNTYEYKKEKHGWSKTQFDEYNKSRSVTLKNCVERHGEEGLDIWNQYVERQRYTNTLEYFIEKYGEQGEEKWLNYNHEKAKSSTMEWIKSKYSVDDETAIYILSNRRTPSSYSQTEKNFVERFQEELGEPVAYSLLSKQFAIWNRPLNQICFYDVTCSNRMKIIEYNGDYWHCNPAKYSSDFFHKQSGLTAKQIWDRDFSKIQSALDRGFSVKIVWENEYLKNTEETIKECVTWWNTPLQK